jgi:hypothetical protein
LDRFKRKASSAETHPSELMVICESLKRNIGKYGDEVHSFDDKVASSSTDKPVKLDNSDRNSIEGLDIHKSSIINFDFYFYFYSAIEWFEWYECFWGVQKLAIFLILSKSLILSALTSVVFIHYGDILIEKYDLVNKYPKLAKFIELRQKYQKYYFILYIIVYLFFY